MEGDGRRMHVADFKRSRNSGYTHIQKRVRTGGIEKVRFLNIYILFSLAYDEMSGTRNERAALHRSDVPRGVAARFLFWKNADGRRALFRLIERAFPTILVILGLFTLTLVIVFRDRINPMSAFQNSPAGSSLYVRNAPPRTAPVSPRKAQLRTNEVRPGPESRQNSVPAIPPPHTSIRIPHASPTATEVPFSMDRDEIIATFGEPDASATWFDRALYEKLFYRQGKNYTEILIRSGRVVSTRNLSSVRTAIAQHPR